jgi:hypothetical protein
MSLQTVVGKRAVRAPVVQFGTGLPPIKPHYTELRIKKIKAGTTFAILTGI